MPGLESFRDQSPEVALSRAMDIVDETTISPGVPTEREVFVVRIPEGMDLEQERVAYEAVGGQVRYFGETVDLSTISYEQWLTLRGAEIQYGSDLTKTA